METNNPKNSFQMTTTNRNNILRTAWLLLLALVATGAWAQKAIISGTVSNAQTGLPLAQASATIGKSGVAVVTNDDGFFTLKAEEWPGEIIVSSIGFESQRVRIAEGKAENLKIQLKPTTIQLNEIVVWTGDPRELVYTAIRKIPDNYSQCPELFDCFYRETAMKRQHFIYVAEGIIDMYKTAYNRPLGRDRVAIRKGRRLLSPKSNDTLSVKVMGGPTQPIQLDVVKNLDLLLNEEELGHYSFEMEMPTTIDGRLQQVVSIKPREAMPYALYYGRFYIDQQTLAFTRVELSLDMKDRAKATQFMLVRKPLGVHFKPKELSCLIDYRFEDGVSRISYIRNTFRFNCDWKHRLFSTSFAACCEMVVTDRTDENIQPISGRQSFDSHDAFYDRVAYFQDPHFWEDFNIIEPTETLDKAIEKLVKNWQKVKRE